MSSRTKWEDASFHVPLLPEVVRLLVTYKDDSYQNAEGEYVFFETHGHFSDDNWRISPPRFVADTFQEAEEKLKVMFWQYKTPHPKVKVTQ